MPELIPVSVSWVGVFLLPHGWRSGLRKQHNQCPRTGLELRLLNPESSTLTMGSLCLHTKAMTLNQISPPTYRIVIIIFVVIMTVMNSAVYSVVEQLVSWRQHNKFIQQHMECMGYHHHHDRHKSFGTRLAHWETTTSLHSRWSCSWC